MFIRKTDSLINPQFWAEDGLFFIQQYNNGISAMFIPHAGYLHLVPRTIALLVDFFSVPYAWVPAVYNYLSLAVALSIVGSVFSPRFRVNNKPLIALSIVLVPHYSNEVFLTITNLQWMLALMMVVVLAKEQPSNKYGNTVMQYVYDLFVIIICGLSGPFIMFLAPFFAWKWGKNRTSYNALVFIIVSLIAFVQFKFVISEAIYSQEFNMNLETYSSFLGKKYFGVLFLGNQIAYKINGYILCSLYLTLLVLLLYLASQRQDDAVFIFIGVSLVLLLSVSYKFRSNLEILITPSDGVRYFYIPSVMLVWSLISLLEKSRKWIAILLALAMFASFTSGFRNKPLKDYNWNFYSELIEKKDVIIPINPEGWKINVKARP